MVAGFVGVVVFLGEVVAPVILEVAVGCDGASFQDHFGADKSPAGPLWVQADVTVLGVDDRVSGRSRVALT